MSFINFKVPYQTDERFARRVAYFSMEFAIHQPLKIYSGGLGFCRDHTSAVLMS